MLFPAFRSVLIAAALLVCSLLFVVPAFAQNPPGDVVMVLPFENTSNRPEYNWVGESFADSLTELLNKPGLLVVSGDERSLAYQRVGLPETMIPSRATSIKLAREAKATMIVLGTYTVTPPQEQDPKSKAKTDKSSTEAYVKAVRVDERDEKGVNYLKNALRLYADANGGAVYTRAAFELGRFYMLHGKWKEATEYFIKLQKKDPHYTEAAFYAGLAYAKVGDWGRALASLVPLATEMPLIGVCNNAGAVAV